jgi:hypothetical protein
MRCDLHGCILIEAKDELMLKLEECQVNSDHLLEVVHGHHGGTVLRDYIRSREFLEEVTRNGFHVKGKNFSDDGMSLFHVILKTPGASTLKRKANEISKRASSSTITQFNVFPLANSLTLTIQDGLFFLGSSTFQEMIPVGSIEINPQFYYSRDQNTIQLRFEEKIAGGRAHATQGVLILYNNKIHAVFGNEILMPNIKASYRDFYLRKENVKDPFRNVIIKNLERVEMTSTTYSLSLQVRKVSVQVSKYQKLYRTDQKLVITLN